MVGQLTEGYFTGEFLVRESYGISRDIVTFDNTAGAVDLLVESGTVVSNSPPSAAVVTPTPGNTGNGTVSNVQANLIAVELGTYLVTLTGPTSFTVAAPDGSMLAPGTVGTGYLDGIGFSVAAGGTAFVAGDAFNVVVANGVNPAVTPKAGGNTGTGTLSNVEMAQSAIAMLGNYRVQFTSATSFNVFSPAGVEMSAGSVGTYYEDQIGFLITAGGVAFGIGDSITIGFGVGSNRVTPWNGSAPVSGIIYSTEYVSAGSTLKMTAIMRSAEVNTSALRFPLVPSPTARLTAIAQLHALTIIAR